MYLLSKYTLHERKLVYVKKNNVARSNQMFALVRIHAHATAIEGSALHTEWPISFVCKQNRSNKKKIRTMVL